MGEALRAREVLDAHLVLDPQVRLQRAQRRARRACAMVQGAGADHVTVKALGAVEGQAATVLGIKANPPAYRQVSAGLGELLQAQWGAHEPLVQAAAADLAKLGDEAKGGKAWKAAARKRLDRLQRDLVASGGKIPKATREAFGEYLAAGFLLGQTEVAKSLGWEAGFSLVDQDAISGLTNSGLYWVGNHYGDALDQDKLLAATEAMIRSGKGRVEGGKLLEQAFLGEFHKSDSYWRGLAATAATRSRSFGAMSGMEAAGATRYEYVNPLDERTSAVCEALDGTSFTVKGSLELRDKLLAVDNPEDWKAISPWPKPQDLVGLDGELLGSAELQAKGIAWPPLHFHCRSSVDVTTWAPISSMDLDGQGAVERAGPRPPDPRRRQRPNRNRPSRAKAKAPKAPSPWDLAKGELDSSTAELRRLGLDPNATGLSSATADLVRAHGNAQALRGNTPGLRSAMTRISLAPRGAGAPFPTRGMAGLVQELQAPGGLQSMDLATLVQGELDAHYRRQGALRAAIKVAPRAVREQWRRDVVDRMIRDILPSSGWSAAKRQAVVDAALESTRAYPTDKLHLFLAEGERVVHNGRENRAFAMWGTTHTSGNVTMNLGSMVTRDHGTGKWVAVQGRQPATLVHEIGHRLDGIYAGDGRTGKRWVARPDYPEIGDVWSSTFGDPFYGNVVKLRSGVNRGAAKLVQLPNRERQSKYMYVGDWVTPYEARIYAGGTRKPALAGLMNPDVATGGPVEFIAMASQYVQESSQIMLHATTLSGSTVRRYVKGLSEWSSWGGGPGRGRDVAKLIKGRRLYGNAYRDGLEAFTGAGRRMARNLVETGAGAFPGGDPEVARMALAIRFVHGTPVDELLGAGGALTPALSGTVDLAAVEAQAKLLEALPDADALEALKRWTP